MNDALERLKNRQRPTVPSRDASLMPVTLDTSTSRHLEEKESLQNPQTPDISTSRYPELEKRDNQTPQPSPEPQSSDDPGFQPSEVGEAIPPLKTKQTTLRMESGLSDRLHTLCRDNGLSREVLIEAMFEFCEQNPEALAAVLAAAEQKNEYRQQVANQRRAQSMMKRFAGQ